jgi:hypothetical protein
MYVFLKDMLIQISRITIHLLAYWWNCLREVQRRDKIKTKGTVNK